MEENLIVKLKELKKHLFIYLKTLRKDSLITIRDILEEICLSEKLKEFGCDEKCRDCFLSFGEEKEAIFECKLWALYSLLAKSDLTETKNEEFIKLSKELYDSLDKSQG